MASVPILNTGANTAVYLDNSQVNRSAEKLQSEIIGTEKLKLNKALQEEDNFIKAMAVDPVGLMTQAGIKQQSEILNDFQETWSEEMRKSHGILSTDQKIAMQQHKVAVQSAQQNLAANQQRYLQELKMYQSNPSKYDEGEILRQSQNFFGTGEFSTMLRKKPGLFMGALDADKKAYFSTKPPEQYGGTVSKDGQRVTTTNIGDVAAGKQRVFNLLVNHEDSDAFLEQMATEFVQLPDREKKKYLDTNQDGKVDETEMALAQNFGDVSAMASNPIVKWAMDNYGAGYQTKDVTTKSPPSSFGMGGASVNIGGKPKSYTIPTSQGAYQLSKKRTSYEFYPFNLDATMNFKLGADAISIADGFEEKISAGTTIDAQIVGYDASGDNIILQPTSGVGSIGNAQTVVVPRSSIENQLPELNISKDGKAVKIGEGKPALKPKPY